MYKIRWKMWFHPKDLKNVVLQMFRNHRLLRCWRRLQATFFPSLGLKGSTLEVLKKVLTVIPQRTIIFTNNIKTKKYLLIVLKTGHFKGSLFSEHGGNNIENSIVWTFSIQVFYSIQNYSNISPRLNEP